MVHILLRSCFVPSAVTFLWSWWNFLSYKKDQTWWRFTNGVSFVFNHYHFIHIKGIYRYQFEKVDSFCKISQVLILIIKGAYELTSKLMSVGWGGGARFFVCELKKDTFFLYLSNEFIPVVQVSLSVVLKTYMFFTVRYYYLHLF